MGGEGGGGQEWTSALDFGEQGGRELAQPS